MKNERLRLKITDKCQRACEGCCNKDFPEVEKLALSNATQYKEVYITGGEPLLEMEKLKDIIDLFSGLRSKVYIYSSMCTLYEMPIWHNLIQNYNLTGITFTIHEEEHINEFIRLDRIISLHKKPLSLRLNKFDHFDMKYKPENNWDMKEIHWLKNCPLPEGEDFREL